MLVYDFFDCHYCFKYWLWFDLIWLDWLIDHEWIDCNIELWFLFTLITTVPLSSWFTSQSHTIKVKPFPFTWFIVTCHHLPWLFTIIPTAILVVSILQVPPFVCTLACSSLCDTCRSNTMIINTLPLSRQGSSTSLKNLSNDGLMESKYTGFLVILCTYIPWGVQQIKSQYSLSPHY